LVSCTTIDQSEEEFTSPQGFLRIELELNEGTSLPVLLEFPTSEEEQTVYLNNQLEQYPITADNQRLDGDTLVLITPIYLTEIALWENEGNWIGEWRNKARSEDYVIPFTTTATEVRFNASNEAPMQLNGEWKIVFGNEDPSCGLGLFEQQGNTIIGSIRTETGDYRFLEGNAGSQHAQIVTFDIAHAFSFDLTKITEDSIAGMFLSGNHWSEPFYMVRDESFELANPNELTHLNDGYDQLEFSFPDMDGELVSFPSERFENKVVIVQIMGSWCPNCMDESVHFKKLYEYYHEEGLEIVAVSFERSDEFEKAKPHIEKMKSDLGLPYTVLYGGRANKKVAAEKFPALNHILSFPTSIFIDREGKVRNIHTGFNGPGTGEAYTEYIRETDDLLRTMLLE